MAVAIVSGGAPPPVPPGDPQITAANPVTSLAHGNVLRIDGGNFQDHPRNRKAGSRNWLGIHDYLNLSYDDFESGNLTDVYDFTNGGGSQTHWTIPAGGPSQSNRYASLNRGTGTGNIGLGFEAAVGAFDTGYFFESMQMYIDHQGSHGDPQTKIFRAWGGLRGCEGWSQMEFYIATYPNASTKQSSPRACRGENFKNDFWGGATPAFYSDWELFQQEMIWESAQDADDSRWTSWVNNQTYFDYQHRKGEADGGPVLPWGTDWRSGQNVDLGIQHPNTTNGDGSHNMTDWYASTTRARVWLGNASTWAACTIRAIQLPLVWGNTQVDVAINQGQLAALSGSYLYLQDKDGVMSDGFMI